MLGIRGGIHDFTSKLFRLTVPKHFVEQLFCAVFQKISGSKNFMDKRRGISRFSVENYLSHSGEIFRRGTISCFTKFRYRKSLWIRGEGEVSRFSVYNFFSHSAESFRRGISFSVLLISGIEKVWLRGGVSRFSVENYLSHSAENFRRGIL